MFVRRKERAGFLRVLLGNFAEGPGESFHDQVVRVCCKQGADFFDFEEVVWASAPTQSTVLTSAVRLHQRSSLRAHVAMVLSESLPLAHIGPERYIAKQSTEYQLLSALPSFRRSSIVSCSKASL